MTDRDTAKASAQRIARLIGCAGAHQADDGTWMPCATHEDLVAWSRRAEPAKKTAERSLIRALRRAEAKAARTTFTPPENVRAEARRALHWMADGQAGPGFTDVGRRRAGQLANGQAVSVATLRRMRSYFARHAVDADGQGYAPGEPGYPSPGRVAWAAWGGDAGRSWANATLRRAESASKAAAMVDRTQALGIAKMMGCSGTHRDADGNWQPCASRTEMLRISTQAETINIERDIDAAARRRARRRRATAVRPRQRAMRSAPVSLPGGGLVSAPVSPA